MYGNQAVELVRRLKDSGIINAQGEISVELLNTRVAISDKSAVGDLLQEWLGAWMTANDFYHRVDLNTQVFPDFYLGAHDDRELLEVKSFDYSKTPNFDVAPFDAYVDSISTKSYRVNADYLIFGYTLENGIVTIKDIWLKKIWEITCPSNQYALKVQQKRGKIYNIRPYNFKTMSRGFQPFTSRLEFINAIKQTLEQYQMRIVEPEDWSQAVLGDYSLRYPDTEL